MPVEFHISPRKVAITLTIVALFLALVSYAIEAYEWSLGVNNTYWVKQASDLFNVTYEANIPTWYNASLFLFAALFASLIATDQIQKQDRWRIHWVGLTLLLLYLSIDDASAIHEMFTVPIRAFLGTSGYLYFAWLLVGIPFAIVMGLLFLPFVLALPTKTRWIFIAAGLLYLSGAVGVEAINSNTFELNGGIVTPQYTAASGVEEFLEMFGIIVLIYGLQTYIQAYLGAISIHFSRDLR